MAQPAYESVIRELYLQAVQGPLRIALGQGSYPPFLVSGDVVLLERGGLGAALPGEFVGVRGEHGDVRLVRLLDRDGDQVRVFSPVRIESVAANDVLGRGTHVERGPGRERIPLHAALSPPAVVVEKLKTQVRAARRRFSLKRSLGSVYWDLVDAQESGISETGDILTTNRCPVGCTFCIYSCVPTGLDMRPELVRQAAQAMRKAGIPRVRVLGGEPFMFVPHLVECFQAIRESYAADDVIILTSGYFGTSVERTRAKIDPLFDIGLRHLHLSFDAFHLERYPVSCYERCLEYCAEKGLEAALVVHYSAGLAKDLDTLLELRRKFPFDVRITTVSREGDASLLTESETSVAGFEAFRSRVLDEPGIDLISEERSCFRWTVFPDGAVHFCCKENDESRVGNLKESDFPSMQRRLKDLAHHNRMNVLRFVTGHKGEVSGNACLTCPLRADEKRD